MTVAVMPKNIPSLAPSLINCLVDSIVLLSFICDQHLTFSIGVRTKADPAHVQQNIVSIAVNPVPRSGYASF